MKNKISLLGIGLGLIAGALWHCLRALGFFGWYPELPLA